MEIDHLFAHGIEIKRVHGEIAPPRILLLGTEDVVAEHPAVLVLFRGIDVGAAEGRDLDRLRPQHHVHEAKASPDDERAPEQRLHLLGPGVGRDVEILGRDAEEQIAHGAAHHIGGEAGLAQRRAHLGGGGADGVAPEAVLFVRRPQHGLGGQPEHPPDEPLDHRGPGFYRRRLMTSQPRRKASPFSPSSGSTATGRVTRSSSARSLWESL